MGNCLCMFYSNHHLHPHGTCSPSPRKGLSLCNIFVRLLHACYPNDIYLLEHVNMHAASCIYTRLCIYLYTEEVVECISFSKYDGGSLSFKLLTRLRLVRGVEKQEEKFNLLLSLYLILCKELTGFFFFFFGGGVCS